MLEKALGFVMKIYRWPTFFTLLEFVIFIDLKFGFTNFALFAHEFNVLLCTFKAFRI